MPTGCYLLLSLICYPPSPGTRRMGTSAEPFPCFPLNTMGRGLVLSAGLRLDPLPTHPRRPCSIPAFQLRAQVCCQGMGPAGVNGIAGRMS